MLSCLVNGPCSSLTMHAHTRPTPILLSSVRKRVPYEGYTMSLTCQAPTPFPLHLFKHSDMLLEQGCRLIEQPSLHTGGTTQHSRVRVRP